LKYTTMIFVRDKGRMCNNILQYGHVYAWGREHGCKTMSMRFAYKYPYFHICDTPYHNFPTYLFAKYAAKWHLIPTVEFHHLYPDITGREATMQNSRFVLVEGWWTPWHDLFLKYKQEIIELFAFKDSVRRTVDTKLRQLPKNHLRLGVHIRRGDYKTWHDGKYYFTDRQYLAYIQQFLTLQSDREVTVCVCGNDPEVDKELFKRELKECHVVFPEGNPGEDLYLLSNCDYLIGAPSTFTLVAAMYHDLPLCWIADADAPLTDQSFDHFNHLFRHIL